MTQKSYHIICDEGELPSLYGIESSDGNVVHRLSSDFRKISMLVEEFNRFQLSPIHFYEAVDDFRKA